MEKFLYTQKLDKHPKINVWFAFPAIENFAMASLGYLSIFKMIDLMDNVFVERVYADTKTTRCNVEDVRVMGFSTSFEIDILTVVKMLKKYNIPLKSSLRGENDPLIFAGGPAVNANPLPYQEFYDFISIGEGQLLVKVFDFIAKNGHLSRDELLEKLKDFEGIWVPKFGKYKVELVRDKLDEPVATPILSEKSFFQDTFVIEIERGCPKMCNFCLASWMNLPARFLDTQKIISSIDNALKYTDKIALLGAYVAGHPDFDKIIDFIHQKNQISPVELSISSLRADLADEKLFKTLVECGQKTATIAIEAGSERMRQIIKKDLSDREIFETVKTARESGLKGLKIYTMIGFPGETDEDIKALVELAKNLKNENKGFDLTFSLATLIPKAHTPFEDIIKEDSKSLEKKIAYLKKQMHKIGVTLRVSSVEWDAVQAVLSRSGASLADYIIEVCEKGGNLGAFKQVWREFHKRGEFKSLEDTAQMPYDNTQNELPWAFINAAPQNTLKARKQEYLALI